MSSGEIYEGMNDLTCGGTSENRPIGLTKKAYLTKYDGRVNQSSQMYLISRIAVSKKTKNGEIWNKVDLFEVIQ